jgi:hypothetical protein
MENFYYWLMDPIYLDPNALVMGLALVAVIVGALFFFYVVWPTKLAEAGRTTFNDDVGAHDHIARRERKRLVKDLGKMIEQRTK